MNSFFGWIGGKNYLKKEIVKRFPEDFDKYIEVFGGAAWVLFYKEPSKREIYNDYNSDLVNLFKCVKYHMPEFKRSLSYSLSSRQLFNELKENYHNNIKGMTEIQRAVMFFLIVKQSYGNQMSSFNANRAYKVDSVINHLDSISNRLSNVVIENLHFESLIKLHDKETTFFYLDSPYYGAEKYYQVQFSDNEHIILHDKLKSLKGKFLLSYNNCEYIRDLYKDFHIESISRNTPLKLRYKSDCTYNELFIKNY